MSTTGKGRGLKKYEVLSPEIEHSFYDYYEPPESSWCWAIVEATNKRNARAAAIKHPDFSDWVKYCRDADSCPFAGLSVTEVPEDVSGESYNTEGTNEEVGSTEFTN